MRKLLATGAAALLVMAHTPAQAQHFDEYFTDQTLRIDYTFAGDRQQQMVALDAMSVMPRWYGKRQRLAELPVKGNGQVTVRCHKTGEVIYRNSFSSLFHEWLVFDDSEHSRKSFENVFLVPMPKDTVDITLDLFNHHQKPMATMTQQVAPSDILIRQKGQHPLPYTTISQAADTTHCIHIAYLAEGYTADQMDKFVDDARKINDAIFSHEPYRQYRDRFNVVAVKAVSQESGTSIPLKGIWRNTAVKSSFSTFYQDRYITTMHLKDMHDCLAGTPYEHIIVLANSEQYGGGGIYNSYNLFTTGNEHSRVVAAHEFSHSFAALADEYAYEKEQNEMFPSDTEPWERNITTLVDFNGKWEKMIKKGTPVPTPPSDNPKDAARIGLFEGAGYKVKGVYRSQQACRMNSNTVPGFCTVCTNAIEDMIKFYTE